MRSEAWAGLAWGLRGLRDSEAADRRLKLLDARWRARDYAWHIDAEAMDERRGGGARSR
jgi:hypothetical protein